MKTAKYIATSGGWNVPCRSWKELSARLPPALILTVALSATGCRSSREAVRTSARCDSLAIVRTTVIRQGTPLPPRAAKLDISLDAASELPEKAVYLAKENGLTLTVERKDSTLHIKAETDSIVPTVTRETTETSVWKTSESETPVAAVPRRNRFLSVLIGVVACGSLLLLVRVAWRNFHRSVSYGTAD